MSLRGTTGEYTIVRVMGRDEKTLWDKKYSEGSHCALQPDLFLVNAYSRFLKQLPGDALDIAGGVGGNALWLAHRGWRVKLIDVSEKAIGLANENARKLSVRAPRSAQSVSSGRVETQMLDLSYSRDLGRQEYDLVIVFFYLQRELFPAIVTAIKPGGFLLYKTYTVEQQRLSGGPRNPDYLLRPGELKDGFRSLRILHYQEKVTATATAELAAQKPS